MNYKWLKENRYLLIIGLLFLFVTNIVYIQFSLSVPPEHVYTGNGLESVSDKFVYYSMILQGQEGDLFMKNIFTSEPQHGMLLSPHWFIVGQISNVINVSPAISYHIVRIILTILFLFILSLFVRKLFSSNIQRMVAYSVTLFSSGLGWFYLVIYPHIASSGLNELVTQYFAPIDLNTSEFNTLVNFVQSPVFMTSYLIILGLIYLVVRFVNNKSFYIDATIFALSLLLVIVHPYDTLIVGVAISALLIYFLYTTRSFLPLRRLLFFGLSILLGASYHILTLVNEPALRGWLVQNRTFSPPLGSYVWGLGVVGILAVIGLILMWKRKEKNRWWLAVVVWSFVFLLLVYLPVDFNRRLVSTWFLSLSLLASYAIVHGVMIMKQYIPKMIVLMILAILIFSGSIARVAQYVLYQPTIEEKLLYYHDSRVQDFFQESREIMNRSDIVLVNTSFIGTLMGAYVPMTLYRGHSHQTINNNLKWQQALWFFNTADTDSELALRKEFLQDNDIRYIVLYRPALDGDVEWLVNSNIAQLQYTNDVFDILKVNNDE